MRTLLTFAFVIISIVDPAIQKTLEGHKIEDGEQHTRVKRADGLKPGSGRSSGSSNKWNGPIIFSGDTSSKGSLSNRGGAGFDAPPVPSPCPGKQTFCEAAANYPIQVLNNELSKHASSRFLKGHFFVEEAETFIDRFNTHETLLCPSTVTVVFPKVAQATTGDFRFVVNTNEYKQGIRVEVCQNANSTGRSCDIPGTLSNSYSSVCVQRYIKRTLVVLKSNTSDIEGLVTEPFDFPSCCTCTLVQGDRFGGHMPQNEADRFGGNVPPTGTDKVVDVVPHGASHTIGSSASSKNNSALPAVSTSKENSLNSGS